MNIVIFLGIILIALMVQLMVEAIKAPISALLKYKGKTDNLCALIAPFLSILFAIALCVLSGADLFIAFGYALSVPYVGSVVSGIIASLGANKVYDLLSGFQEYKAKITVDKNQGANNE